MVHSHGRNIGPLSTLFVFKFAQLVVGRYQNRANLPETSAAIPRNVIYLLGGPYWKIFSGGLRSGPTEGRGTLLRPRENIFLVRAYPKACFPLRKFSHEATDPFPLSVSLITSARRGKMDADK
jgi:hypothetical protein